MRLNVTVNVMNEVTFAHQQHQELLCASSKDREKSLSWVGIKPTISSL